MRPLPCAVRPFGGEILGSWVGRVAAQYRMSVLEFGAEYRLDLRPTCPLGWLVGPYSARTIDTLAGVARIEVSRLQALDVPAQWSDKTKASYCVRCAFMNPQDVTQPFWKREWFDPTMKTCRLHQRRLETITAAAVNAATNKCQLIKAVGSKEAIRRRRAALATH